MDHSTDPDPNVVGGQGAWRRRLDDVTTEVW